MLTSMALKLKHNWTNIRSADFGLVDNQPLFVVAIDCLLFFETLGTNKKMQGWGALFYFTADGAVG